MPAAMTASDPLFDDAPVGYVVADENGLIRRVNRAFLVWTQYEASELVGVRRVQTLLTPGSHIYFETHVSALTVLQDVVNDVSLTFLSRDATPIFTVAALKRHGSPRSDTAEVWFVLINASGRHHYETDALRARSRLERVQGFTSALAISATVDDVASVALAELVDGVKADHGFVALVAGGSLRILQSQDTAPPRGPADSSLLLTTHPTIAEVVATGNAAFIEAVAERAHGQLSSRLSGEVATRLAVLPLVAGGRTIGILWLASITRSMFEADERSFLLLFAKLAAQSLEVVKLHDDTSTRARQSGFLAKLSQALDDAMSFDARCQALVDSVVPELADYATVESPTHEPRVISVAHRSPELVAKLRELRSSVEVSARQEHSLARARATHEPQVLVEIPAEMYDQYDLGSRERELLGQLAPRSYVGLPMLARGTLVGTLMLVMAEDSKRNFLLEDLPYLTDIANRAAVSLENARLYEHERLVAVSFQRELLGRPLPKDDRLELRAVYHAGGELVEIGGDYFDSFFVDSDRIALAVGDVVGSGIPAATVMGQLRTALRAFALEGHGPAETLNRLEVFATSISGSAFSSVAYAELDLVTSELVYACAGHPPPILIAQGEAVALWDGRSALLGISQHTPRSESRLTMPLGSTLVLYTDGLVEARTRSADQGIADLIDVLQTDPLIDLSSLVTKLSVSQEHRDDICVLALTTKLRGDPHQITPGEGSEGSPVVAPLET